MLKFFLNYNQLLGLWFVFYVKWLIKHKSRTNIKGTMLVPSSHFYQLNEVVELIFLTSPMSVLDVGIGFGKYGFLCREYLDLLDGREKVNDWKRRIDGIEIFENYITPLQKKIYDHIYIGNALDILPNLNKTYDLILLIDIIEHCDYKDGEKLLELCRQHGKNVIVSTPKMDIPQPTMFGNPFEAHKAYYGKKFFRKYRDKIFISNFFSLIVYLGENTQAIKRILWKRRLLLNLPLHLKLKSISKSIFMRSMKHSC